MANIIQEATQAVPQDAQKQSVSVLLNSMLDSHGMRKRFEELLGARTPQFISGLISMVNGDKNLQAAMYEAPMTVITSALKAATFDLPIEPSLGYAYIVPFKNFNKDSGTSRMEATFILGYKGMEQLAMRTGAYVRPPDAVDVREGELVSYNRLTGDAEFNWIEDEDERDKKPVVGYAGYFRLKNGAEKTIYMSRKQIDAHEARFRKGKFQTKGWRDDYDSMARKTVLRRLIGKYGLMSIEYQGGDRQTVSIAQAVMDDGAAEDNLANLLGQDTSPIPDAVDAEYAEVPETDENGEIIGEA